MQVEAIPEGTITSSDFIIDVKSSLGKCVRPRNGVNFEGFEADVINSAYSRHGYALLIIDNV